MRPHSQKGTATTTIATRDGSGLIKRLRTHWAHKPEVRFDENQAHVPFDDTTRLQLDTGAEVLQLRLEAADDARLVQMHDVVADHLQRMARRETLQIAWEPGTDSPG